MTQWFIGIDGSFVVDADRLSEALEKVALSIENKEPVGGDGVWIQVNRWNEDGTNDEIIPGDTYFERRT